MFDITLKNGILQSVTLNVKRQTMGIDERMNIGISTKGIEVGNISNWVDTNSVTHAIKYNISLQGIGIEWGQGENNLINGNGFKLNLSLNPIESLNFYSFSSLMNGNITDRTETGAYINSGLVALATVTIIAFAPEIMKTISHVGSILVKTYLMVLLFSIINEKINSNSCDLEES